MFDIIAIGDATIDVFLELDPHDVKVLTDPESKGEYLAIPYAEKVPVQSVVEVNAVGNAANNAIGSARLGLKASLYAVVGDDERGHGIKKALLHERVSPNYIQFDHGKRTNYSVVLNLKEERTILVYHEHRDYQLPNFAPAKWYYYTSIGKDHAQIHAPLVDQVTKKKVKLGFNPGTHQLREGLSILQPILAVTEVLFVNAEESETLTGEKFTRSREGFKWMLGKLTSHGPKIAVISDGPRGSYAFDGTHAYFLPIYDTPVVERTGVGDSYATAFVAALIHGENVAEAMRWGTFNASSVIQYIGAQKGLLTRREMEKLLREHTELQPAII
ncbi:MAG: hypothetical protein HY459_01740 [Parcubacteria group bacterium]|nr:hypothetical protein [Parcubacteria group bacterium]